MVVKFWETLTLIQTQQAGISVSRGIASPSAILSPFPSPPQAFSEERKEHIHNPAAPASPVPRSK